MNMITRGYITSEMKSNVVIHTDKDFPTDGLKELFTSNGLEEDTPLEVLVAAFKNSTHIAYATRDDRIVAIARSMDDNIWSANIDCVCVHRAYQLHGIGRKVFTALMGQLLSVPCISVSPNNIRNAGFYCKFGFKRVFEGGLMQLIRDV